VGADKGFSKVGLVESAAGSVAG